MKSQRFHMIAGVVVPLGMLMGIWLYFCCVPLVSQAEGVVYDLLPGTSKKKFMSDLSQQGVLRHPWLFSVYVLLEPSSRLKAGEYRFPPGATGRSIWKQVTQGTGLFYRAFTIVPGWSFVQLRSALSQAPGLHHHVSGLADAQIMYQMGNARLAPEGEFFPDTYYYTKGISDLVVLKQAFDLMQHKLKEAWSSRLPGLPYRDAYEALIAASLIEKEAYLESERTIIAGVLVNRLKKGMLLQFDPTVIYGLGPRYDGKIHKANLLDANDYNTYVHKGLPPTPIAIPGMSSLQAALRPQHNDFFYFVAKRDKSHAFSKTLAEHRLAVVHALEQPH